MLSSTARSAVLLGLLFVLPGGPAPLAAQGAPEEGSGAGPGLHGEVVAGQTAITGSVHRFGGVHASFTGERWGAGAQLQVGSGSGFSSTYFTGGPSIRIPMHPRADLQVMAGFGYYGESVDASGRSGSVFGPAASALVRIPTGPLHVAVGLTGWYAEYTDEIAVNPVPADGLRFFIGVGR